MAGFTVLCVLAPLGYAVVVSGPQFDRAPPSLLLPIGRYRANEFRWSQAFRRGGSRLIGTTVVLLMLVEAISEAMQHHVLRCAP